MLFITSVVHYKCCLLRVRFFISVVFYQSCLLVQVLYTKSAVCYKYSILQVLIIASKYHTCLLQAFISNLQFLQASMAVLHALNAQKSDGSTTQRCIMQHRMAAFPSNAGEDGVAPTTAPAAATRLTYWSLRLGSPVWSIHCNTVNR